LTRQPENIVVTRFELLLDQPDAALASVFGAFEAEHPQFGLDWLENLARNALEPGDTAVIWVARISNTEIAALPLLLTEGGQTARALANFYSTVYSPVSNTEHSEQLFAALFHALGMAGVYRILLDPMDPGAPLFSTLQRALAQSGWRGTHTYFCFANWSHTLETGGWQNYLNSRTSKTRNTVRRRTRKFLAESRGELVIVHGGSELESAIRQFTHIYNSSWKREEPYPQFMPELARLAARRGWLRLGIAFYDGHAVASQLWLVAGGVAYIFKLAYRPDFAHLSPGTVLSAHMMAHVIDTDEVQRIDYLSGDDAYKRDWMSQRRKLSGIAAYNPRIPRGLYALASHRLKQAIKGVGLNRRATRP
tara:strand:- start:13836 stop:14927 length:1092 start_codon:yes stop_codon:yes gene_type:complete